MLTIQLVMKLYIMIMKGDDRFGVPLHFLCHCHASN